MPCKKETRADSLAKWRNMHCKTNLRDSWICFDHTFLELELGKLFLARESLLSDIPAVDGNPVHLFLQCEQTVLRKRETRTDSAF